MPLLKHRAWLWLVALLLACGFGADRLRLAAPRPDRLRFAHTYTAASERAILDAVVTEFETRHPGVRVDQIVENSDTYQTVGWRLQFQGRQPPDVYFCWQGAMVEKAIRRGWAMDLAPRLSAGFIEGFVPTAVPRQHHGIYHLPQSVDLSNLVWYNRDLFTRGHVAEPRTLEDWLEGCAKLRAAGVLPLVQGNRDLWPMGNLAAELLGQSLGADRLARLFSPGARIESDALDGLGPLVWLEDHGGFDLPGVLDRGAIGGLGDIDAKVFFLSGRAAQHIIGSWFLADIRDAENRGELAFPVGVFPVPCARGETHAQTSVTTGWMVNPATRNPRAAVDFIELLLSRKYQAEFARLGVLSARRDAVEFTTAPLAQRALEILATTPVMVPPPDTGYSPDQAYVFYELVGKLLTGRVALPAAAADWMRGKENLARKGL